MDSRSFTLLTTAVADITQTTSGHGLHCKKVIRLPTMSYSQGNNFSSFCQVNQKVQKSGAEIKVILKQV